MRKKCKVTLQGHIWASFSRGGGILTADSGASPLDGDAMLAALMGIGSHTRAQTLTVPAPVTVTGVSQAVLVEPGHIHLEKTQPTWLGDDLC